MRYCLRQWRRAPRGVGREAVDPHAGCNRSGMIRTPRVRPPTLTATRAVVSIRRLARNLLPPSLLVGAQDGQVLDPQSSLGKEGLNQMRFLL